MIKFEFTLNDQDAENLISILREEHNRTLDMHAHHMRMYHAANANDRVALANADWYKGHAEYLESVIQKVLQGNTRVEQQNG